MKQNQSIVVDQITKKERNWASDGWVVLIPNGLNKLQFGYRNSRHFLTMNNVPLFLHEWYPTYSFMMQSGYGKDKIDPFLDEKMNKLSLNQSFEDTINQIHPLLQLFPSGLYFLAFIYHSPTIPVEYSEKDKTGFFWTVPNCHYGCNPFSGCPTYLAASQHSKLFNNERVNHYRQKIQQGESLSGLTFYPGDGLVSTILDGHHRATASYLEQVLYPCLTIVPLSDSRRFFPNRYLLESTLIDYARYKKKQKKSIKNAELVDQFIKNGISWEGSYFPADINARASKYEEFFFNTVGLDLAF